MNFVFRVGCVFAFVLVVAGDNGIDPEAGKRVPEIIKRWGYPVEEHNVTTEDGYILTMHRIPYGKDTTIPQDARRPVVFLQHGLEASSSSWVTNLPSLSLGYLFADLGYDVWMGNVRGNLYSKAHTKLSVHSHEFWKFSWDQMVDYDLPAMIDTALKVTNHTSLYYVGHSQGTLIMFSKLSNDIAFAKKIRKFFALAPVCTVQYIQGLLEYLAKDLYTTFEIMYKIFGEDEFLPDSKFMQEVEQIFCDNPTGEELCDSLLFLIGGTNSSQMNATRIPVFLSDEPAGTSTMNILHWAQMVRS
uniref:Partial AB-hydrolase lipase domain-containing protein n=1 Tax=Panagrolaimus sp. JU765 TaxID=591449 RepID=A0AC34RE17_9BILA